MQPTIEFTKMQGAGNDYVYINCMNGEPCNDLDKLAIEMSDRHFGVGGDCIILILPSDNDDFRMRMFNADGSEGKMCGNGSRCVAKYVHDKGLTDKQTVTLETLGGIKVLHLHLDAQGEVDTVTVDMGEPELEAARIPVISAESRMIDGAMHAGEYGEYLVTAVSMGNPHGVIFVESLDDTDIHGAGRILENNPQWPDRANIEFVEVKNRGEVRMRVWERGSGETLACGTGACATVVAGVLTGRTDRKCRINLLGGVLDIEWSEDGHVYMTGPARFVFDGVYTRRQI